MKHSVIHIADRLLCVSALLMASGVWKENLLVFGVGYGIFLALVLGLER